MITTPRRKWAQRLAVACVAAAVASTAATVPAAAAPVDAAVASADELAAGEAYMRRYMEQVQAPGMAYAVVRGDQVLLQGAWGVDGDGRPMTAQTPFLLGSTSKSFTALAVTQLARAGRVDLDAPARTYLPWLRLGDGGTTRTVTVRQLLTHTSGLPAVSNSTLTDRYDNSSGGLARSVRDLASVRPVAAAGQGYRYSDANYMILGALVENVTGETFGGYLRRHVLDPLAMTRSAATAEEARAVDVPAGHRYYLGRPQRHDTPFDTSGVPYGFLAASLDDLTHYASAQISDGRYRDAQVLDADGVQQMHTGTTDTGHGGSYGLGWKINTLDGTGVDIVWHSGATPNFFSHVVLVPRSNLAVVVLTNVYALPMDASFNAGAFDLARILHGHAPTAAADDDPIFMWVLAGLLTIAAVLLALLATTLIRLPRVRLRDTVRSRRRTAVTTAAWIAGCALAAAVAAWLVPTLWGAGLAKVQMWAPDIGHAVVAVLTLAGVLALTRIGIGAHALGGSRRPRMRA